MDIFTDSGPANIANLGETQLILSIREWLGGANPPPPFGIGDDCAVHEAVSNIKQLITTDSLVYKRHFDSCISPEAAGAKLVKRNLSDIAAMGGRPSVAVVSLLMPKQVCTQWLKHFYQGMAVCAGKFSVQIAGGDICEVPEKMFAATMTLHGHATRPVTRAGAKAGDHIFTTGTLGGSLLGKHYQFTPRLKEGQWLAQQTDVHAMMDITDGLSKDLPALTPEGTAASLDIEKLPISEAAETMAQTSGRTIMEHALSDGEDYELVFTVSHKTTPDAFMQRWNETFKEPLYHIGQMIEPKEPALQKQLLDARTGAPIEGQGGFEHLR